MEKTEGSLKTLIKLACNAEYIPSLVDGVSACLSSILTINEQGEHPALDRLLHNLFNQMLQVTMNLIFTKVILSAGNKRLSIVCLNSVEGNCVMLGIKKAARLILQFLHQARNPVGPIK